MSGFDDLIIFIVSCRKLRKLIFTTMRLFTNIYRNV